jgi:uncharacterized protein YjbI with pentapeptide repeats
MMAAGVTSWHHLAIRATTGATIGVLKVGNMANEDLLAVLRQGVDDWNGWRRQNPDVWVDLTKADLSKAILIGANLTKAILIGADLSRANLFSADLSGALLISTSLARANLSKAKLVGGQLFGAKLPRVNLIQADLSGASLALANLLSGKLNEANLSDADLSSANLREANLTGANLSRANLLTTNLVRTNLTDAVLTGCRVYGISAWDLKLDGAEQKDLVITPPNESEITVDNLEVAQFIYLLLNNERVRHVIDTITSKVVLILGRFTPERKAVLDALREELRKRDYTPVVFDFEKPGSKDLTGTIQTLANMARFVIADLTDPSSVPHELAMVVPATPVAIQPILLEGRREYSMFVDLRIRYHWVLEPFCYVSADRLIADLREHLVVPAEAKARELRGV